MSTVAFDGTNVALRQKRWRHIVLRHPELKNAVALILDTVAHPDEVYVDPTGAFHALRRVGDVSDFLVVIYSIEDEGYKNRILYKYHKKNKEVQNIQKIKTLLEIDAREVLERMEAKYNVKLPRRVITLDFDENVGDLYIRFKTTEVTEGEPTEDGKAIIHYDKKGKITAVEITDISAL
ncbi:MAG: DUF2283 domain-containing protein [Candidatus Bathyarchaeota archaeon]|nr:DUF2283 domain-containing protein [Candidatus Bathyarchaeota archaeon]